MFRRCFFGLVLLGVLAFTGSVSHAVTDSEVIIGVNIPLTGPYALQGLDQQRAYSLAQQQINDGGGILGKKIRYIYTDSKSDPKVSVENVNNLIDQGADMITGGSSSAVALAVSELCQKRGKLFLATLTYSNEITGANAHRHTFRETYNAWMAAKALGKYLTTRFPNKKYFYITADYNWGWTTRDSLKKFTNTENATDVLVPLGEPVGSPRYRSAIQRAMDEGAEVMALVLFGRDMIAGLRECIEMGVKERMQIVVPNFELHMALGGNPPYTEKVLGAVPWYWEVPYKYNFEQGKKFVEAFRGRYGRPPGSGGGTAYTNIMLYKWAAENTGSFDPQKLIPALEGHSFVSLKDEQTIRAWDHQTIQSVYVVQGRGADKKSDWDVFEVLEAYGGEEVAPTREENPVTLEPLEGEKSATSQAPPAKEEKPVASEPQQKQNVPASPKPVN